MTPKQELFAQAYLETSNASEAYKRAYNTQANANTVNRKASQLLKHPEVRWCKLMFNALLSLHLNKYPYIMLCMFIMNVKEKTKLHLTESLQRRFKAIQHIVIFNHNALKKNLKSQKSQNPKTQNPKTQNPKTQNPKTQNPKTQNPKTQNPKTQNPKDACILCYIAFTHLLGSLYSGFNLWLQLHSTRQQKTRLLHNRQQFAF